MASLQYSDQPIGASPLRSWLKYAITGSTVLPDVYRDYADFPKRASALGDLPELSYLSAAPSILSVSFPDYADRPKVGHPLPSLPVYSFLAKWVAEEEITPIVTVKHIGGGHGFFQPVERERPLNRRDDRDLIEIIEMLAQAGILN